MNRERQSAVLGHLLVNNQFFKQAVDRIEHSWFNDAIAGKVWQAKQNFWRKYKRIPSEVELEASEDFRLETQSGRNQMHARLVEARGMTVHYGLDALLDELTPWLHSRHFHEGITQAQVLFNAGDYPAAYARMEDKLKLIRSTSFEERAAFDFENYSQFFEQGTQELHGALSFGIDVMDRLLLPAAWENGQQGGGLMRGDQTVLLAPTNVGKTTTMTTIGAHNVWHCKDTLFIAHEGTERDLVMKMWCSMLNVNAAQVLEMYKTEDGRRVMDHALKFMTRYYRFVHMPRPGLTVEEVGSAIRRLNDERIAQFGKGFDLVINDYPSKLVSEGLRHGQFQKRNMDDFVYNYFVQLALDLNFHSLVAIQANRTGAKINRGHKGMEERLLVPEDVNEAYGPMQTATNVITINRPPWYETNGYVCFYVGKSRSNEKGWAVMCKSNYKNCITHSNGLGAIHYRGDVPLTDQVDTLFQKHSQNGKPLTPEVIRAIAGE